MAFSRLVLNKRGGGARTDKVRVMWLSGKQLQTEVRIPGNVATQLKLKPLERKVGITIEVGSGEHLGLFRISRTEPGQAHTRLVNTTPHNTFTLRTGGVKPTDMSTPMTATPVSYMVEHGAVTLLLPPSRYAHADGVLNYIKGEHAAELQEEEPSHNSAALNVPADL